MECGQTTELEWQRQDPLPHRYGGQDAIGELRGGIAHAAGGAARAYTAPLARECHKQIPAALIAMKPEKAMRKDAAFEIRTTSLLDIARQAAIIALACVCEKRLELIADDGIKNRLRRCRLHCFRETRPANYAYLYDRVAASHSDPSRRKPQRYGTQGSCTGPGVWEPLPIEEPEQLDLRRAQMGLGPQAEYIGEFLAVHGRRRRLGHDRPDALQQGSHRSGDAACRYWRPDIGDQTFSTSSGELVHGGESVTSMPFGVGMSCDASPSGVANIDLRGTPFAVAADEFLVGGAGSSGSATYSNDNRVVDPQRRGLLRLDLREPRDVQPLQ